MTKKHYLGLFVLASVLFFGVALFQQSPGYMDADYYLANARLLLHGHGFYEPYIWNYLTNPTAIPTEAFTYWMPLTSLLATASMIVFRSEAFLASRILLILIAAAIPPLTAYLCMLLTENRTKANLAGLLAILPGFYLTFLTTTDSFGLYMLLGGIFIILVQRLFSNKHLSMAAIGLGVVAGLLHLSRADGLVWLITGGVVIFVFWILFPQKLSKLLLNLAIYGMGYMGIMVAWYSRNYQLLGKFFPPGGSKTLWLTVYDQIYLYPPSLLNFQTWLESGWSSILGARWWASTQNLQTFLAVQGLIFLLPLILLGLWRLRKTAAVKTGFAVWLSFFLIFTFVLPFPGARGSFYHAGASLQVLFWSVIPSGLDVLLEFGVRHRNWNMDRARHVFQVGTILLAAAFTLIISVNNLKLNSDSAWGGYIQRYARVEDKLDALDPTHQEIIMVNNPPGYYLATGRPAIVIPYGDTGAVLNAAKKFGAKYLMLEPNTNFPEIYQDPMNTSWMRYLTNVDQIQLYELP